MNPFVNNSIITKLKVLWYYVALVYKEDFVKIHKALAFIFFSLGTIALIVSDLNKNYVIHHQLREFDILCLVLAYINLDLVINRLEKKNG